MEFCDSAAVTPALELAKLALVTSRDEEEDEADKGGTDSSNDTDATLVEDGPSRPALESSPSASSILGKRTRESPKQLAAMEVDSPVTEEKDGFMIISQPSSPHHSPSPPPLEQVGPSDSTQVSVSAPDIDGDVEMIRAEDGPSRRPTSVPAKKAEASNSVMMFGTPSLPSISRL
jgi:ubiquitin carboxyl-terminal hydrolase 25